MRPVEPMTVAAVEALAWLIWLAWLSWRLCDGMPGMPGMPERWGLADMRRRPWMVDVLEVGDAAREAKLSTWSIVWACQPLLTLTMA